jgi:hypothetical protein
MLLWKRLRNLLPGAASEIKDIPRDYFTEFVYRSSRSVHCILSNAKRLRDDAKILFDRVSYSTAASISVLSLEESGKACLVQWAERKWLSNEEVLQLLAGC